MRVGRLEYEYLKLSLSNLRLQFRELQINKELEEYGLSIEVLN